MQKLDHYFFYINFNVFLVVPILIVPTIRPLKLKGLSLKFVNLKFPTSMQCILCILFSIMNWYKRVSFYAKFILTTSCMKFACYMTGAVRIGVKQCVQSTHTQKFTNYSEMASFSLNSLSI